MTALLRWALVPLSAVAVWYLTFIFGLAAVGVLDTLCPADLMVSGLCTAWWHAPAVETLILACTVIVAVGLVILPGLIAPAWKFPVALIAYGCGAAFAIYVAIASFGSFWKPFIASALSGSAALWMAATRWRKRSRTA
jgi:hypothetical protein